MNCLSPCEASHHQSRLTPEDELFKGSLTVKLCDGLIGNISKDDPVLSFPGIHHRFSTSCFIFPGLQSGHHESAVHIWIPQVPVQMAGISIHRSLKHTTPRVHWVSQPRILHYWLLGNQLTLNETGYSVLETMLSCIPWRPPTFHPPHLHTCSYSNSILAFPNLLTWPSSASMLPGLPNTYTHPLFHLRLTVGSVWF